MRSLSGPVLRDSLLPYAFLYALGAPCLHAPQAGNTVQRRQKTCSAKPLTATRSTASRKRRRVGARVRRGDALPTINHVPQTKEGLDRRVAARPLRLRVLPSFGARRDAFTP